MKLTFDDVLILPNYSEINSRSQVDLTTDLGKGLKLTLPVISSNMDTVTEVKMAKAMKLSGGIGCLHRFNSITDRDYIAHLTNYDCIVSFGLGKYEMDAVNFFVKNGAKYFCLDVAHGSQQQVANAVRSFKLQYPSKWLMVGNFASPQSIISFLGQLEIPYTDSPQKFYPDAIKVGIGPGSACTTRIKTGVGYPQLSAISDIADLLDDYTNAPKIIADGGMKTSGDIAKALAAGADAVMLGGMLAGTDETPGEIMKGNAVYPGQDPMVFVQYKEYRGSASKESYEDQNKDWACAEGESFTVPYKGPVKNVLDDIRGGLQSSFSYIGAKTLKEFQNMSEFIIVSQNSVKENKAHGKNN